MIFKDRIHAGQLLAKKLKQYKNNPQVLVLGMPRGGVVVAHEISKYLNCPLDLILVRKIGAPNNPEYGIGAIAEGGKAVFNEELAAQINHQYLESAIQKQQKIIDSRIKKYKLVRPQDFANKIIILVDDGLATGFTAKAAILTIRELDPQKIILAVPVAPVSTIFEFEKLADKIVFLHSTDYFFAVGQFYENFEQTTDEEVLYIIQNLKVKR
jgi:predicted phosphoribosyltransferase